MLSEKLKTEYHAEVKKRILNKNNNKILLKLTSNIYTRVNVRLLRKCSRIMSDVTNHDRQRRRVVLSTSTAIQ